VFDVEIPCYKPKDPNRFGVLGDQGNSFFEGDVGYVHQMQCEHTFVDVLGDLPLSQVGLARRVQVLGDLCVNRQLTPVFVAGVCQ
jgi:hypothetical protein